MLIYRVKRDGKFTYHSKKNAEELKTEDLNKCEVKDPEILEYIKKLVIPPAYKQVQIFYQKNGTPKILYMGYDSKDRLQRIYSPLWRKKQDRKKFCLLLTFGEHLPKITSDVEKYLDQDKFTKEKVIAMIVRLVMVCYFRIGNRRYKELYGSYGAMNIEKRHITISDENKQGETMYVEFKGKKGVMNTCHVVDKKLIREVKRMISSKSTNQTAFQYLSGGKGYDIKATEFNDFLNAYNPVITSKMFRTWDSNILFIIYMRSQGDPCNMSKTARKKKIVAALKSVSQKVHNTSAVLKKAYAQGGILDMYLDQPRKFKRLFMTDSTPRSSFMSFLKCICKGFTSNGDIKL